MRNRFAQEGDGPVGKRLHIGWPDHPRVPGRTWIVRLARQHVNLLGDGFEERGAELDGALSKPLRRSVGTDDTQIIEVARSARDRYGWTAAR